MADNSKLQFYTGNTIDKIECYSIQTDASSGLANAYGATLSFGSGTSPSFALGSIANPFGKKGIPTMSFSINSPDYYEQTDQPNANISVSAFCGCSDSKIYFYFQNQSSNTPIVTVKFAITNIL